MTSSYCMLSNKNVEEPFCSSEAVLQTGIENAGENSTDGQMFWTTQLLLSLEDTACFMTQEGPGRQNKHVIKFLSVRHQYGIVSTYEFGIPIIRQSCLCDCNDSEEICKVEDYQYRNCTSSNVCYRTLRPYQSNSGCVSSGPSSLCCEIQMEPYEDWRFQAVQLKQPNTVYVVQYKVFSKRERQVDLIYNKVFNFTMNTGLSSATIKLRDEETIGLELQSNRPHRQLEPGMYFWQKGQEKSEVRGNVRINEPSENSLEKLGWFRYEKGSWRVRRGLEKVTKAQHVHVENCKAQRYLSSFDAEQFVLQVGDDKKLNYDLGNNTKDVEPWVKDIKIHDRLLEVVHSEGNALGIFVKTTVKPSVFRHNSQLGDFSGTIHLDSSSNCYMNLTFKSSVSGDWRDFTARRGQFSVCQENS
uniref:Apple domain-containing protein n=1 Tax=Bursaphelenchus xylophilus TaxID=6326 RepID=A0A1I7S2N5_BURXY